MEREHTAFKVRVLLATLDTNVSDLAAATGIERTAANKVLTGTRANKAAREKIAEYLGEKVRSLILNQTEANGQQTIN